MGQKKNKSKEKSLDQTLGDFVVAESEDVELIEKKHRQIIDGAIQIFIQKGFHRTTMREIRKACGMSTGQLYHYISSKDDILFLVYDYMEKELDKHLNDARVSQIRDPLVRLTKMIRSTIESIVENRKLTLFFYTETKYLRKEQLRVALRRFDERNIRLYREILSEIKKKKSLKIDIDLAASFISYLAFFAPLAGWSVRDKSSDVIIDSLVDFIFRGIGLVR